MGIRNATATTRRAAAQQSGGAAQARETNAVRNKQMREAAWKQVKAAKKKDKKQRRVARRKEAAALGDQAPPPQVPRRLEDTRLAPDETPLVPAPRARARGDDNDDNDDDDAARSAAAAAAADAAEEAAAEEAGDEFAAHFAGERPPHVLLTTSWKPSKKMYALMAELLTVFPSATFYKREDYTLKRIIKWAAPRGFTDVVVLHEDRKQANSLLVCHLPDGPTAHFRLTNLVMRKEIRGHGAPTAHRPELVLNNFGTRLGQRVGRLLGSLFCTNPQFRGRRVVTFHNQRDYIFFRHHRYVFETKEDQAKKGTAVKARLQELGPRFTLKLMNLQRGTFDSKHGEFEWMQGKEADSTSRRKWVL